MPIETSSPGIGVSLPDGWRLSTFIALVLLLTAYYAFGARSIVRNAGTGASVRQQAETVATLMPHTRREMYWWTGVSLTAGFCEEFLFRGYFIRVFAAWPGWWGAAALSLLIFAGWHAYQGWNGVPAPERWRGSRCGNLETDNPDERTANGELNWSLAIENCQLTRAFI